MRTRIFLSLCLLCGIVLGAQAQKGKGKVINNKFSFQDGFYKSFDELKANQPGEELGAVGDFQYEFDNEENIMFPTEGTLANLAKTKVGSFDDIWGLSMYGVPYIKVQPDDEGDPYFVRLYVIGKICYFYYKSFKNVTITMNVHDPFTGVKVGEKDIVNREQTITKRFIAFEDGRLVEYNLDNFKDLIKDDKRLLNSLNSLESWEAKEKLFKTLQIYNDRHPVYLEKIK